MVVRTPEQKIKGKEVLPPWPRAKIMVPQSYSEESGPCPECGGKRNRHVLPYRKAN
jgi:hypothetical protein